MKNGQNGAEEPVRPIVAWQIADLRVEPGLRRVTRGEEEIALPGLSFDLLLALIAAAPNLVSTERLIEEVWRGQVVSPETVTQRVKLLRDALNDNSQNPRYVAGVRGQGYRLLPPVVELSPAAAVPRSRTGWIVAAAAAAVILAAGGAIWLSRDEVPAGPPASFDSLAILPFENRSPREADAFFADGIHDDLLTRLSRIHDLRVIARTSVIPYREQPAPVTRIARELGVDAVLTGAVQRAGDQVRIQVQLIDAQRDAQLWAETYDRSLTIENVFAIQSEISRAIASALAITLRPVERERLERTPTSSLAAYDSWLKGRQEMNRYTAAGLRAAVTHFQRALEADAEFAQAHVGLAEARLLQNRFRLLDHDLALQLANSSAERAIALDPTLAEAFAVKGDVLRLRNDLDGAEAALRQAIALNPNLAAAWVAYGWLLADQSRWDEQIETWRRAGELDPLSPAVGVHGAFSDLRTGNYVEAEKKLRALLDRHPDFPPGHVLLGEVHAGLGDQATAVEHFRRALDLNPALPLAYAGLVHALLDLEADEQARGVVMEAWSVPATPRLVPSLEVALATTATRLAAADRQQFGGAVEDLRQHDALTAAHAEALLHLAHGNAGAARRQLEAAEPRLRGEPQNVVLRGRFREVACTYAYTLAQLGERDQASDLARSILDRSAGNADFAPRRLLTPAICRVVLGEVDTAIESLQQVAKAGQVPSGWRALTVRPELEPLRRHPRFEPLIAQIRGEAARQRRRISKILTSPSSRTESSEPALAVPLR